MCRYFAQAGVDTTLVGTDRMHPTGAVGVRPGPHGPLYEIATPAAWDFIEAGQAACAAARNSDLVVFGTLAQRHPVSRGSVRALVAAARAGGARCFADLNLRAPFYDREIVVWTLRNADVVKLNADELRAVSYMLGARGEDLALFAGLVREFALARAVMTDGAAGAWIWEDRALVHAPACPTGAVADSVGAGDAFTAMLARGLARGFSLAESAPCAARLASLVVSSEGATPPWTPDLLGELGV